MNLKFPFLLFFVGIQPSFGVSYAWNTPNSSGIAFPGMQINELDPDDAAATSPSQFHGIGTDFGGDATAFSSAMGLQPGSNGQITAIGSTTSPFSLAVGDDITLRTAWTPGSAASGNPTGLDNVIFQLGITSSTAGRFSDGSTDQIFFGGVERASSGSSAQVIGSFLNENSATSGSAAAEINGGTAISFPTKPFGTFDEQVYSMSLRLQRLSNNDLAWGLSIDHYMTNFTNNTDLIAAGFLVESGIISESDHGFGSWDEFYPALGFEVNDRAQLSITGTSYDWAPGLPETVPDLIPEPSVSILSVLGVFAFASRRKR